MNEPCMPLRGEGAAAHSRSAIGIVAVVLVLVLAFAVRAWRLGWGLEHGLSFPDELAFWKTYLFAFTSPGWSSLFGHSLFYPTLYGYASGVAVVLAQTLGWIPQDEDLHAALLVARSVSVAASVVTVIVVGITAASAYGRTVGVLAAALMASIPIEAMQTHYASCDSLLGTTVALVLLAGCAFARQRTAPRAAVCGACVGLAFATKYNAIALAAVPAWVVLEVALAERSAKRSGTLSLVVLGGFVLATVLACPPWVFETDRVVGQMRWVNFMSTGGDWRPANAHLSPDLGWHGSRHLYRLVASLPFALGWPLAIVAVAGVGFALGRREPTDRVLLAGVAAYLVLLGQTGVSFTRYLVPLLPALAILAARALAALPVRRRVRAAIALAVVGYGFALGFSQVARFSYDQQIGVAQWIRDAFPRAAWPELRVVVPAQPARYFQLEEPLARVGITQRTAKPGQWLAGAPEVFVMPEWYATSVRRDRARAGQRPDLDRLESGAAGYVEAARWSSTYLQQGFYTRLDPAFAGELYMGAIGFRVYVRDDLLTRARGPGADPR